MVNRFQDLRGNGSSQLMRKANDWRLEIETEILEEKQSTVRKNIEEKVCQCIRKGARLEIEAENNGRKVVDRQEILQRKSFVFVDQKRRTFGERSSRQRNGQPLRRKKGSSQRMKEFREGQQGKLSSLRFRNGELWRVRRKQWEKSSRQLRSMLEVVIVDVKWSTVSEKWQSFVFFMCRVLAGRKR